jgi:hypothetical protein
LRIFLPGINFLTNPVSQEVEDVDNVRERKMRNYFLRILERCFWSHRSRKEGLVCAGWSKRSNIVLLVAFVLNVDDGQMYRLSMQTTNVSRPDVPNCDLVFMRL